MDMMGSKAIAIKGLVRERLDIPNENIRAIFVIFHSYTTTDSRGFRPLEQPRQ
jgi:hypothetical protein